MKGLHRSGWEYVINNMFAYHHDDNTSLFIDCYMDKTFHWIKDFYVAMGILPYKDNWIGFVHHTPNEEYSDYNTTKMIKDPIFLESIKTCKGIFTLTNYLQKWFQDKFKELNINVPIFMIYHPTNLDERKFSIDKFLNNDDKKIVQIGGWMRDSYAIYKLHTNSSKLKLKKAVLKGSKMENYFCPNDFSADKILDITKHQKNVFIHGLIKNINEQINSVIIIDRLSNEEYDELLESNIVFLNLVDASACNTVLECIARDTPILINKIEPIVELLGEDYPLFYTDINEAGDLVNDIHKIIDAHLHIKKINKNKLSIEYFLNEFNNHLKQIYQKIDN